MSIGKAITGNRSLLIYFSLLILVPGILLAALAFRGIQNDQALVGKRNRLDLEQSGEELVSYLKIQLDSLSDKIYHHLTNSISWDSLDHPELLINILKVDEQSKIWLLPSKDIDVDNITQNVQLFPTGNKLEFRDKNYSGAINYYKSELKKTKDSDQSAQILLSLARLYRKSDDIDNLINVNSSLYEQYSDRKIINTVPAGWIAKNEIIQCLIDSDKIEEAFGEAEQVLNDIISNKWTLDWDDYLYISEKTDELIKRILKSQSSNPNLESIKELYQSIDKTDSLDSLLHLFRTNYNVRRQLGKKRNYTTMGESAFFSEGFNFQDARYLIIFDMSRILNLTQSYLDENPKINSYSINTPGNTILEEYKESESVTTVDILFPDELPPWKLTIRGSVNHKWLGSFDLSNGVYVYIFLFIMAILIFGFYFLLRTINAELKLSNLKSDFVASVSHEFKSPITAIRQLSERLQENKVPSAKRKMEYYQALHAQSIRLSHLVDNILDFAKLESGERQFSFKSENINQLIKDTTERFTSSGLHDKFPVHLDLDESIAKVPIDRSAIVQILENLLDNAYKYAFSPKGAHLETWQDGKTVNFAVRDFGNGISKEFQEKIFDRFYRINNDQTSNAKGSGIGLSLVKKIVEGHKGRIHVENPQDGGTRFIISLTIN